MKSGISIEVGPKLHRHGDGQFDGFGFRHRSEAKFSGQSSLLMSAVIGVAR